MRGFYPGNQAPYGLVRWYAAERTGELLLEQVVDGAVVKQKGVDSSSGSLETLRGTRSSVPRSAKTVVQWSPHCRVHRGGEAAPADGHPPDFQALTR
ncbi:hypothetical protein BH23GEM9_BH23GEM9_05180 [soil metagenome]